MAKKKKTTHRRRTRRRGMSGAGGGMLMHVLGVIGGAVATKVLTKSLAGKVNDKVLNGGAAAIGAFLPKFIKGPFGMSMGAGMIAVGGLGTLNSFGVLNGIGAADDDYTMEFISGTGGMNAISEGFEDPDYDNDDMHDMSGNIGNISVLAGVGEDEDSEDLDHSNWQPRF